MAQRPPSEPPEGERLRRAGGEPEGERDRFRAGGGDRERSLPAAGDLSVPSPPAPAPAAGDCERCFRRSCRALRLLSGFLPSLAARAGAASPFFFLPPPPPPPPGEPPRRRFLSLRRSSSLSLSELLLPLPELLLSLSDELLLPLLPLLVSLSDSLELLLPDVSEPASECSRGG